MSEVTQILSAIEQGDPQAAEQLLPLVYDELRKLAAARMAQEKPGHTLDATALVHEAYLRLVGNANNQCWDGRSHFFAAAAEAMRRILIDSARRKKRDKRGGERARIELKQVEIISVLPPDELLALDEALDEFARQDPQAAALVKLHCFGGLTLDEAANCLGLSVRTAYRDWAYAKAWLHRQMSAGGNPSRT
jgi:RNA polymerase sigma factor (TIGR02999 family)